jgi:drug/metabolite transporter (DMT)-like permease
MTISQIVLILFCVLALAVGQLLFKMSARNLVMGDHALDLLGLARDPWFLFALSLYALATLLWIWLLRKVPLVVAYPFFALSFVVVPFLSRAFLGEQVGLTYWAGVFLIMSGIVITIL